MPSGGIDRPTQSRFFDPIGSSAHVSPEADEVVSLVFALASPRLCGYSLNRVTVGGVFMYKGLQRPPIGGSTTKSSQNGSQGETIMVNLLVTVYAFSEKRKWTQLSFLIGARSPTTMLVED